MAFIVALDRESLKEGIVDTALATPINLMLNFICLTPMLAWQWTAGQISIAMTCVFFTVAIIRKYYVRQWFKGRRI